MQITDVPFVAQVGIYRDMEGRLMLSTTQEVTNHLGTLHAGAQYLLAETASGDYLQQAFPELATRVVPVLRSSAIKFKRQAEGAIVAFPDMSDEERTRFLSQFSRKGRATVTVSVEVRDTGGHLTSQGTYEWFVQQLPDAIGD